MPRSAGGDHVADARQAGERLQVSAELGAQARQLGHAARDQAGARVVSVAETVRHAHRHRYRVLRRAAELDPDHVGVRVDAERVARDEPLQHAGGAARRDRRSRWPTACRARPPRRGWGQTAPRPAPPSRSAMISLGTLQSAQLETLGQRELQRVRQPPRRHPTRHRPHRLGRDRIHDEAGGTQVGVLDGCELELGRQLHARQEVWVAMRAVELAGLLRRERQHLDAMSALPKQPAEGTAPATRADDGDVPGVGGYGRPPFESSAGLAFHGKVTRFSQRRAMRRMLPRCAQMTMAATSTAAMR